MTKKIWIDEAVVKQTLEKIAKAKELCDKQSKLDRRIVYGNVLIEHFDTICQALQANNEVVNAMEPVACSHSWTEESRANGWRSSCRLCGKEAAGSGQ